MLKYLMERPAPQALRQMLYFLHQNGGTNPYLRVNVVENTKFLAIFLGLKLITPELLYELQHSPLLFVKDGGNVVLFAGFITQSPLERLIFGNRR